MNLFNKENFWIGLHSSVMNPNGNWRDVLMSVEWSLGYQIFPCYCAEVEATTKMIVTVN